MIVAPNAQVDELKKFIVDRFKLEVPYFYLRLLCTVSGGDKPLLLESGKTLAEQGVGKGSRVVVEGSTTPLVYYFMRTGGALRPARLDLTASSFAILHRGAGIFHMKMAKGGDTVWKHIFTLEQAAEVCALGPRDYLLLEPFFVMRHDSQGEYYDGDGNLGPENMLARHEMLPNEALAQNVDLQSVYGKLEPLNGGRGVFFFKGDMMYVECDGLLMSGETLLLNTIIKRIHDDIVTELVEVTAVRMREVLAEPTLFTSVPADIMLQLTSCKVVVLAASSRNVSQNAVNACAKAGVHLLERHGTEFKCTLSRPMVVP
jgi:hypothetical protein